MKVKNVPSRWIYEEGLRLDSGPYMSGALESKILLEELPSTQPLCEVTLGGLHGIFHAGRKKRLWVESREDGIPFLSSTDILEADLSHLSCISRKQVKSSPELLIKEGWTLITRSGTIGRMAYARSDMDGLACSEHVIRVIPDENKILPGFLFAYLSSKYGVPLITQGTYGSIIQSIEPKHIASLPVPRFEEKVESEIHKLVDSAANLRVSAAQKNEEIESKLLESFNCEKSLFGEVVKGWNIGYSVSSNEINKTLRLEGYFHNPIAQNIDDWIEAEGKTFSSLGEVADVYDVPPFKHIYVDPEQGVPFFTSGDLFKLDRVTDKYLSKTQTKDLSKYILSQGWVLLARSGQLGGIIGRPQFADSSLDKAATSDHVIRIVPHSGKVPSGYLYAYLSSSKIGYPLLTRSMTGASVPALWPVYLKQIKVLLASEELMQEIDREVRSVFEMRVKATAQEGKAREHLEKAIEAAA